jgi:hypothetical protein
MITKYFLLITSISFFLTSSVTAQEDNVDVETLAIARDVIEVSSAAETVKRIIPILLEQQKRIFISQNGGELTEEKQKEISLILQYLTEELDLIYPAFYEEIAKLYATKFSKSDLMVLRDFYSSDVGRRFTSGSAELSREIGVLGQQWMMGNATEAAKRARTRALEALDSE